MSNNEVTIGPLFLFPTQVMLKIMYQRLKPYIEQKIPDAQVGFRKGRGSWNLIASICWILECSKNFQVSPCFIDWSKVFDYMDHESNELLWKIWVCLSTWLYWWIIWIVDRESLSKQIMERENGLLYAKMSEEGGAFYLPICLICIQNTYKKTRLDSERKEE